jgi:hypothetical protein
MSVKSYLQIELANGSQLNFNKSDLSSARIGGTEMITKQTNGEIVTPNFKRTRLARGEPIFYMLDHVMRMKYPLASQNQEIPVSKAEFDLIIKAFHGRFDPMGRLRWKVSSPKELGINAPKVGAAKKFLIKTGVLNSAPKLRASYGNRETFVEQAQNAWKTLQQQEILKG